MANRYWVGGAGAWNSTAKWSATSGGASGASIPTSADNVFIDANSGTPGTITSSTASNNCADLTISVSGWTVTLSNNNLNVYGSFTINSGTTWSCTGSLNFLATTTGKTITTNGVTLASQLQFQGVGGYWTLGGNLTNTFNLGNNIINGTLDLSSYTFTTPRFLSGGGTAGAARTIAFGTGNITLTGSGSVWDNTNSGFNATGNPVINLTYSGAVATDINSGSVTQGGNLLKFNITAGTYTFSNNGQAAGAYNFTGFSGSFTPVNNTTVYGDFIISSTMTLGANTGASFTFSANTSNQTCLISLSGKTLNFKDPEFNSGQTGTIFQLQSNSVFDAGSGTNVILTNGTLDLNGYKFTSIADFRINAGTKNITFNGGTLEIQSTSNTAFNCASATNFTTTAGTGTGKISMTGAASRTFVGNGATYNCTLSNDSSSILKITGSNTFTTIANGVQPTQIQFTAGTTTTVTNFNVSGTAGNLVTITSTSAATHTLSKASGTVSSDYLSISYSTATGGASWYAGANSTNGGNNTGWIFTAPPPPSVGNFFLMFGA